MSFLKKHELQTLLPRGKIKKYMRMFEELQRQIPLGDKEKIVQTLNEEFAQFFSKDEEVSNTIEYVTIDDRMIFQFVWHGSRLMVHISKYDPLTKMMDEDGRMFKIRG
ncbi:MAG: hypothetical protein R3250_07990, partial [Melioribacteraceae bacterium]|nr:hypothetical protein [Melioribacteraceae bacterium]